MFRCWEFDIQQMNLEMRRLRPVICLHCKLVCLFLRYKRAEELFHHNFKEKLSSLRDVNFRVPTLDMTLEETIIFIYKIV